MTTLVPYANKSSLIDMMSKFLSYQNSSSGLTVSAALNNFLQNMKTGSSSVNAYYDALVQIANDALLSLLSSYPSETKSLSETLSVSYLKYLITNDDGTVIADSSKNTISGGTFTGVGTNLYPNFYNKVTVSPVTSSGAYTSTSNSVKVTDASGNNITLYGGIAAGGINENHHSRPEMLMALLSNAGTGYSSRYSSSSGAYYSYYAIRLGISSEQNMGTIRLAIQQTI